MGHIKMSELFNKNQRAILEPTTAPDVVDFEDHENAIILANISGELIAFSFNGTKVEQQTVQLGPKS